MVIKTETCFYTEMKIFPGKGRRLIRRDGKLLAFIDQKSRALYTQKIKAQRLTWTQSCRRLHKKGKVETASKKKGRRTARIFRSIQGISVEDIKKRRDAKPEFRKAERDAALRESKERAKKAKDDKKKTTKAKKALAPSAGGFVKVPKSRRVATNAPKSTQR
jgi:large subunit ribosomal protein L24e